MEKEIIYVGDPLCGWCFGFTKVFEKVERSFGDRAEIKIVMGGLKVDDSIIINDRVKKLISKNWKTVMERTGQRLAADRAAMLPDGAYNSEPPCRAVVTIRSLKPDAAIPYYKAIHRAMYLHVKNINDPILLSKLAAEHGVPAELFEKHFNSEKIKSETRADFEFSKKAGVLGLPAFILKDSKDHFVLNQGFKPSELIEKGINDWLAGKKMLIF